jgi:CRISPR-associated protein Csb2
VSSFFSGHEPGGAPIRRESHGHLFYLVDDRNGDGYLDTICIVAPELADRTAPSSSNRDLAYLRDALTGLTQVLAGREGIIDLAPFVERQHRFFASARLWESVTPYIPTRYPRAAADLPRALSDDLVLECRRRGLPTPAVTILDIMGGRRGAVRGRARLMFDVPVKGPLALGRESHFGQGVFAPAASLQIASALA